MADPGADVTEILLAHGRGETGAFDQLIGLVYPDLRRIAQVQLQRRRGFALDATGLVHEVYMKLVDQSRVRWQNRSHFFAIAACAMRQVMVDHARKQLAAKRGGGQHHTGLDGIQLAVQRSAEEVVAVGQVLDRLARLDERLVRIVECRYFAGYSDQETGEALGISKRTVQREWQRARAWLAEEMRA